MADVRDLILLLDTYVLHSMPWHHVLFLLSVLLALHPLLRLNHNQVQRGRNRARTGWTSAALRVVARSLLLQFDNETAEILSQTLFDDLTEVARNLDLETEKVIPSIPVLLCSPTLDCKFCRDTGGNFFALQKNAEPAPVELLDDDLQWKTAYLIVAHCRHCGANYYPDRYTFTKDDQENRVQQLVYDAAYLRVSHEGFG